MANVLLGAAAGVGTLLILLFGLQHRSLRLADAEGGLAFGIFLAYLGLLGAVAGVVNKNNGLILVSVGIFVLGCLAPLRSRFK